MSNDYATHAERTATSDDAVRTAEPGKTTRTSALPSGARPAVQRKRDDGAQPAAGESARSDDPFSLHLVSPDATAASGGSGGVVQRKAVQRIEDETLAARADQPTATATAEAGAAGADAPGVFISYVKLDALPDWMPEVASHAFLAFDDGWSAGFTMLPGEDKTNARVHIPEPRAGDGGVHRIAARRKGDPTSRGKTAAQIKQQIKTYAETVSAGRYNLVTNNCGDWVKRALDQAWLVSETPGYVY